jgi:hypothetical protein
MANNNKKIKPNQKHPQKNITQIKKKHISSQKKNNPNNNNNKIYLSLSKS